MGGHGHNQPYTIPDPSIYKVEEIPQLKQAQDALARQGLKNPWLRNEVWRYDVKQFGTYNQRLRIFLGRGFLYGLGLTVLTVAAEQILGGGGSHHGNGEDTHHGNGNDSHLGNGNNSHPGNGNDSLPGNGNGNTQESTSKHD